VTILRLDLQAGGWRAVPPQLFEDDRLSLDTRAVAGYVCTRSDTFQLSVSGLCVLLGIGKDKWCRMSAELQAAHYLRHIEGKDDRGRFRHELLFSPIPAGGFPKKASQKPAFGTPKTAARPGTANPGPVGPGTAEPGSTKKGVDQISEDHHHRALGGGAPDLTDAEPPACWVEAANYEIAVEREVRLVRNPGGLLKTIIDRYRANGGPDAAVLEALDAKRAADMQRAAQADTAREKARQDAERARAEAQRLAAAEARAKAMTCEERVSILLAAEARLGQIPASRIAKDAFVERGDIVRGPTCRALVQFLMSC
jgi:hypothetical protein